MTYIEINKYLFNCFWLFIPIIIWNIVFTSKLPIGYSSEFFDNNIPMYISYGENILRLILFLLPVIMAFSLDTKIQKIGFSLYIIGTILYFISWLVQIYYPESIWSLSVFGFMAPAFTTLIFFIGIGLIGQQTFIKIPYISIIYIILSIFFMLFHSIHTYIVFQRL